MSTRSSSAHDVVVVGARAAGAATAMLLARAGLDVLVVDRSRYGADTLSTHALMRAGVVQLHRWGLLDAIVGAGTPAVRATTFRFADEEVRITLKSSHGVDALYVGSSGPTARARSSRRGRCSEHARGATRLDEEPAVSGAPL